MNRHQITGAAALAIAICAPITAASEGTILHAYWDPAHVATECTGETKGVQWGVQFTPEQCRAKLIWRLQHDFAPPIQGCVPGLTTHTQPFVASLDAAYNAGPGAFCRSPMAKAFNAGRWQQGCEQFIEWRVTAKGRTLPGLVARRLKEARICLKGS